MCRASLSCIGADDATHTCGFGIAVIVGISAPSISCRTLNPSSSTTLFPVKPRPLDPERATKMIRAPDRNSIAVSTPDSRFFFHMLRSGPDFTILSTRRNVSLVVLNWWAE